MATVSSGLCPAEMVLQSEGRGQHDRKDDKMPPKYEIQSPHLLCCEVKTADISINIAELQPSNKLIQNGSAEAWELCTNTVNKEDITHLHLPYQHIEENLQCDPTIYFMWLYNSTCNTNIITYRITVIISLHKPACLNYHPEEYHYCPLTLLSLSSSFFNHSKSLYLLLTQESFSLKMGRFVYTEKKENRHWFILNSFTSTWSLLESDKRACWTVNNYHDWVLKVQWKCFERQRCHVTRTNISYHHNLTN